MSVTDDIDWVEIEKVMSNFDHEIDREVEKRLREESNTYSQYAAENFYGFVYFDRDRSVFICEIWIYGSLRTTIEAETLDEIMEIASARWEYD